MRALNRVLAMALGGLGILASCGTEFRSAGTGGDAGEGLAAGAEGDDGGESSGGTASGGKTSGGTTSGGKATGGKTSGGSPTGGGGAGSGESGGPTLGGAGSGGAGSGGSLMGGSGGGGTCNELTVLPLKDPGFESGGTEMGWVGSGNFPQYASVQATAKRTGSYGAQLNDTGVGVPGIEQQIAVKPEVFGKTVSVTAWVRLVTFPSMRLLLEADTAAGTHLGVEFSDTDPQNPDWQKLSASLTIPANTDHLTIAIASAVADAAGVAYADDVMLCMDNLCTPCAP